MPLVWKFAGRLHASSTPTRKSSRPPATLMSAVANPGNAGDPQLDGLFGSVAYEYEMGKHEVTAEQYTRFLNAVAATDTYALYNPSMWTHDHGCKIERTGSPGSPVRVTDRGYP